MESIVVHGRVLALCASLLSLCCACAATAEPAVLYVSPYGSDSNNGTSESDPLQHLSAALGRVGLNGEIRLLDGVYAGAQNVGQRLTVNGVHVTKAPSAARELVVLRCADQQTGITLAVANLTLSSFSLVDCNVAVEASSNSGDINVKDMIFRNDSFGILHSGQVDTQLDVAVEDSLFHACRSPIQIVRASSSFKSTVGVRVHRCTIEGGGEYGVYASAAQAEVDVKDTTIVGTHMFSALYASTRRSVSVENVHVEACDCKYAPVLLGSSYYATAAVYLKKSSFYYNSQNTNSSARDSAGAVLVSGQYARVQDCVFVGNVGQTFAGALNLAADEVVLERNVYLANVAAGASAPTVLREQVLPLRALLGEAVHLAAENRLADGALDEVAGAMAQAADDSAPAFGGAVYVGGAVAQVNAKHERFWANAAGSGGALYCDGGSIGLDRCSFVFNQAAQGSSYYCAGQCAVSAKDTRSILNEPHCA